MTDAGVVEQQPVPHPANFTPLDILLYGAKQAKPDIDLSQLNGFDKARIEEIEKVRREKRGKGAIREMSQKAEALRLSFHPEGDRSLLERRFGGGRAKEGKDGKITIDEKASPHERKVFEDAQQRIDGVCKLMTYLQKLQRGDKIDASERNDALTFLLNDSVFSLMFPELNQQLLTADGKLNSYNKDAIAILEAFLKGSPGLLKRISDRMSQIYDDALKLREVPPNPQIQQKQQELDQAQRVLAQREEELLEYLRKRGGTDIISRLDLANSTKNQILAAVLGCDENQISSLLDYDLTQKEYDTLIEEINKRARLVVGVKNQPLPITIEERLDLIGNVNLRNKYEMLKSKIETYTDQDISLHSKLISLNQTDSQHPQGKLMALIDGFLAQREKVNSLAEQLILQSESEPDNIAVARKERLSAERELIQRIDSVVGQSLVEIMEGYHDEMIELDKERLKKAQEEAARKKEDRIANGKLLVEEQIDKRWIHIEGKGKDGKKVIDIGKIASDMQVLISEGEDGLKKLIFGIVFEDKLGEGKSGILVNRLGKNGERKPVTITSYEQFDPKRDQFADPEDQAVFEAVYQEKASVFRDRLFRDYFHARSIAMAPSSWLRKLFRKVEFKGNAGDLIFTDYQMEQLVENFGEKVLTDALAKSKELQEAIKKLKEKGIQVDQSKKLQWLIYLLLILGLGLPFFAAVGPAGGIGAALGGLGIGKGIEEAREKISNL